MLRTEPSFSIYNSVDEIEDEEKNGQEDLEKEESLMRTLTIGESIEATDSADLNFGKKNMGLIQEEGEDEDGEDFSIQEDGEPNSPSMYLAMGLGADMTTAYDGGEVVDSTMENFDKSENIEEYTKRMVDEYPSHPLFLRNYAELLQSKGDLHGAEDYYHRATLADPEDGEILMQYAKLVWEQNHDQDRAMSYFERAAQAAPKDSNILGAYASFLWEIEDDDEDAAQEEHNEFFFPHIEKEGNPIKHDNSLPETGVIPDSPSSRIGAGLRIDVTNLTASGADSGGNIEEYHMRMVEENPWNALVLRNYALFLWQSKGDRQGAEEYFSRAILEDPKDGEMISQYAKLVWELHHDRDKALYYFERAVEATPENSHVLAAYAGFLWEIGDDEDEDSKKQDQVPHRHEEPVTTANA